MPRKCLHGCSGCRDTVDEGTLPVKLFTRYHDATMSELLEGLNDEQRAAVLHGEGPLMIIAGAGTGKTTVITRRIAWLIDQGLAKPSNILALTFTDKAANEMEERVDRLLPLGYVDLSISTFHAFCERVLRDFAIDIGLPREFTLYNEIDAWLLMRRNLARFKLEYYKPRGNPTKFLRTLLSHFSRAKDEGISPAQYREHVESMITDACGGAPEAFAAIPDEERLELTKWREVAEAYDVYQALLLEDGAMDFGDLLSYVVVLLRERPNILAKLREQYTYIVVDEFQDTNSVQYELVKLLASPRNNVTVVGDDDQAIYKFRGAALANILRFRVDFPTATKVVLVRNYRSGSAILDAAYKLIINNNPHRLEATEGLSKQLISHAESLGFVHHVHCATLEDEVESTVATIVKLHDEQGSNWSDVAILVRGNDSADPFLEALERAAVPFRFLAMSGLYTKPLVLDCLSYLRVIDLPFNSPAMYRVISHPRLGITERDLAELMMYAKRKGLALCDAMRSASMAFGVSMEGKQRMLAILDTLAKLRERAKRLPVTELFVEVVKTTGLLGDVVEAHSEIEQQELFRELDRFLARLKRFAQANDDKTLARFIEEFDAEREAGEDGGLGQDPEEGPDVVSVMTVHGAKGLEFKHVFVVNLVEQRFPSQARGAGIDFPPGLVVKNEELDDHVAEERRLFYVAITRAKESIYLMSADDYGGARKKKISRFLTELGFSASAPSPSSSSAKSMLDTESSTASERSINTDLPDRISFSQIAAFSTCPLQYKYAHIIKVPSFGRQSLSFGKTMHNALQRFMEAILASRAVVQSDLFGGGAAPAMPSQADLLRMFDDAWIDEWYESDEKREEYRAKGKESLREFYRLASQNRPVPYALEKGFTLKVGDVLVKGRIDRIDTVDGGVEIIDYKTGSPKDKLAWDDKRQLILYALAAEQCFDPPLPVKRLTYYYLESNTVVSFEPTAKDKEKLTQEILGTMEKIRTSSFEATPGMHCQYCDFKDICPFFRR